MLLFRVLNDFDIISEPIDNGLASKKLLYEITKDYYDDMNEISYTSLNDKEKDLFIKEHISEYIKNHSSKLERKYKKHNKYTVEIVKSAYKKHNPGSFIMMQKYISTLQSHLNYGSSIYTNWISTSKYINSISKYYDEQDIHKLAVIRSNTNGLIDSDYILTIDLSDDEKIMNNSFLCNNINCEYVESLAHIATMYPYILADFNYDYVVPTSFKARSFNYAKAVNEVCVYEYIPSNHIVSILDSLQVDLLYAKIFDTEYFKLSKSKQKYELLKLKDTLHNILRNINDSYALYLYEEMYLNNKNAKELINANESKERFIETRKKILRIAKTLSNAQIKR